MTLPGIFTVSLDVELYWGIRDVVPLDVVRPRLLGDRAAVPRLLDLFDRFGIHTTWATVGFLFFEDKDQLLAALPGRRPRYRDPELDPYRALASLGRNEGEDPFHYGASLVRRIAQAPNQEIGTHTFSHFYPLEDVQDEAAFRDDLTAAIAAARALGVSVESIVFPRNQYADPYLRICAEAGLVAYRGNPGAWMYRASGGPESLARRGARLADAFVPLSGNNGAEPHGARAGRPVDVPASRFLRPWSRRLAPLVPLQLRRIKREMTAAAKAGRLYHLWWHPHNFGLDTDDNLAIATEVFTHFQRLQQEHGMVAAGMAEVARRWTHAAA